MNKGGIQTGVLKLEIVYHVLANRTFLNPDGMKLRNEIYSMWKKEWQRIYASQGSHHQPTADDFVRHDYLTALTFGKDLLAISAHTFLDFRELATYDRDYFKMFGVEYALAMQSRGIERVMTYESLMTNPVYKHNQWNLSLGRLLIRCNSYFFNYSTAGAIMAVVRKDNGLSANLDCLGYKIVIGDKICREFPCDLRALFRGEHLSICPPELKNLGLNLWNQRQIHEGENFAETRVDRPKRVA